MAITISKTFYINICMDIKNHDEMITTKHEWFPGIFAQFQGNENVEKVIRQKIQAEIDPRLVESVVIGVQTVIQDVLNQNGIKASLTVNFNT